jgi:hypothetical protein
MKNEILPAKWVYVTFTGLDHDNLEPNYRGEPTPKLIWRSWVVFGCVARAKEVAREAWEKIREGRNWELKDTHFYANNYRRDSRALITKGMFTA